MIFVFSCYCIFTWCNCIRYFKNSFTIGIGFYFVSFLTYFYNHNLVFANKFTVITIYINGIFCSIEVVHVNVLIAGQSVNDCNIVNSCFVSDRIISSNSVGTSFRSDFCFSQFSNTVCISGFGNVFTVYIHDNRSIS